MWTAKHHMTCDSPLLKAAAKSMLNYTNSYPSQEKINACIKTGQWHELDQEVLKEVSSLKEDI